MREMGNIAQPYSRLCAEHPELTESCMGIIGNFHKEGDNSIINIPY